MKGVLFFCIIVKKYHIMNYKAISKNDGMYIMILPVDEKSIDIDDSKKFNTRSWGDFCKHMNGQKIFGTDTYYSYDPEFDFKGKTIEIETQVVGEVGQKAYYLKINNQKAIPIQWHSSIENELPLILLKILDMIKNDKI